MLLRIEAPHFVAGLEADRRIVTMAAPIVSYMHGWPVRRVLSYCKRKKWTVVNASTRHEARLHRGQA